MTVPGPFGVSPASTTPSSPSASLAIRFAFGDRHWLLNSLMCLVLAMIPVVGTLALLGWTSEIGQRLACRHPQPIPKLEFSDFGHHLQRGLIPFAALLVLQLGTMMVVWVALGGAVGAGFVAQSVAGDETIGVIVGIAVALVVTVAAIAMSPVLTSVQLFAELSMSFNDAFSLERVLEFTRKTYLVQLFQGLLLGTVWMAVGIGTCFVAVYFLLGAMQVAAVHLRWQVYEYYLARGGTPLPVSAPVALPSESLGRAESPPPYVA